VFSLGVLTKSHLALTDTRCFECPCVQPGSANKDPLSIDIPGVLSVPCVQPGSANKDPLSIDIPGVTSVHSKLGCYHAFFHASSFSSSLLCLARQPPVGQVLLIYEVSRSHTTTHHSR